MRETTPEPIPELTPEPPPSGKGRTEFIWYHEAYPEPVERMPEFSTRIQKAIYRALIIGAALAGVYNEPIFRAKTAAPGLGLSKGKGAWWLCEEQLKFLQQFAVCRVDCNAEADDAAFGRIGRWLLGNILSDDEAKMAMARRFQEGSGRARYCQSRNGDSPCPAALVDGGTHSDAHLVVWEVMQVLWVQNRIQREVRRPPSLDPIPPTSFADDADLKEEEVHTSALTVLPGIFNTFRIRVSWAWYPYYLPRKIRASLGNTPTEEEARYFQEDSTLAIGRSAAAFFNRIQKHSKRSTAVSSDTCSSQLSIKFFRYFLQRYLDLQLQRGRFESSPYPGYTYFSFCINLLMHDDVPGRQPYQHGADLSSAGFLDGTELLAKAV